MICELRSPIYVKVISMEGKQGRCIAWIDYGPESPILWQVIMTDGKVYAVKQEEIEVCFNYSMTY